MRPENHPTFAPHLASIQERLADLAERAGIGRAGGLLDKAFEELSITVEELLVAEEEIHVQNEALAASRLAIEEERERYHDLFEFAPDAYLVTDMVGAIREANEAAVTLLGFRRRWSLIGKPLAVYVSEEMRGEFRHELALLAEGGRSRHDDPPRRPAPERNLRLRPRKAAPVDAAVTVAVMRDRDGRPVGLRWLVRDVTVRRRAEEERYRLLVEGTRDYAMILMDQEGCVTGWNMGAERILGWTEAEALGQPAGLIFTPEDRERGAPAQELQEAAARGRALDLRWHMRKDGSRFYADGITEALRDERGGCAASPKSCGMRPRQSRRRMRSMPPKSGSGTRRRGWRRRCRRAGSRRSPGTRSTTAWWPTPASPACSPSAPRTRRAGGSPHTSRPFTPMICPV